MPKGESSKAAMGRRVITGKVGLCPVCCNTFPFHHVSVLPLNAPSPSHQTLRPPCPAYGAVPGWFLPSTGCVGWREGRKEIMILWRLLLLNSLPVPWRKSHICVPLSTSTWSSVSLWLPLSSATGLDRPVKTLSMDKWCIVLNFSFVAPWTEWDL